MKPPAFSYHRPHTVAETLELLATLEDAKLLAGGQSLMPMMNFRYVMPANIIVGLLLFVILLTMMMGWYLTAFENHLAMWRG